MSDPSGPTPEPAVDRRVVLVLSYARPQNIQRIVDAALAASGIDRVIVSNNNPRIDLRPYLQPHGRVELVQQLIHYLSWKRFEIAALMDDGHFVCVDDDVFITPAQLDGLFARLAERPEVPHGVYGQKIVRKGEGIGFQSGLGRTTEPLDIINKVYAFTAVHARRVFALFEILGINGCEKLGSVDDVAVSFAGPDRPMCHDLGPLAECPTWNAPGTALWRQPGFAQHRLRIIAEILQRASEIPWLPPGVRTIPE